ncbi:MAG: enoyl-CoA hydratase/isomerase family protein [Acidimicrobiia bacterium]
MSALGDTVLHVVEAGISTITMHRPDAGNALLPEQREAIIELLGVASDDRAVRAVALRAQGRHFCTGADVGSIRDARAAEPIVGSGMRRIQSGAQRLIAAVLDCTKPVVAVVEGPAAGLGAHLAFACDLVVAADTAYFLEPFLLRGLVVDAGGAYLLPRLVGLQRAKELAFLGDKLSAADARDLGLVNRGPRRRARCGRRRAPGASPPHPRPLFCWTKQLFKLARRRPHGGVPRRGDGAGAAVAQLRRGWRALPSSSAGRPTTAVTRLARSASLSTFAIGVRGSASSTTIRSGAL